MPEVVTAAPWPAWKRVAFRFLFAYFVLYALPFPLDFIPLIGMRIAGWWLGLWKALVSPVAAAFLDRPVALVANGSGDSTWNYLQVACMLVIAAIATLIWSVLDRRRTNYARLHQYLHVYVRFVLASAMFAYGIAKVIPSQFAAPTFDRLLQTYGASSPMGLLWTFMGTSTGYQIFSGAAEVLGGLLLIARRTTLLGALVSMAVMTNVFALNVFYDVPVKLFSFHLLLMAAFVAAPDAGRLFDFFLRRRPDPLFERRWLHVGSLVLRTLLVVAFLYMSITDAVGHLREKRIGADRSLLRGVWNVDELEVDGVPRPPLLTDAERWRRLIFDVKGRSSIFLMNDERQRYSTVIDPKAKTMHFVNRFDPKGVFDLTYAQPDPAILELDGMVAGHKLHAVCKLMDEKQFLLTSRGFHWINEQPFSR